MEVLQKMQLNLFKTDYKDSPGWVAKGDNVVSRFNVPNLDLEDI